ncbi:protein FAM204A-like isoform X3 [Dermacentor silvarum]|uniref:protein FAM204A-like isoform X3 n=1 Tax=Dermacentor silvarum TaxID=543639 RepID=UPI0021018B79|nr:protein FAM204A-like isoform X3 [Dermacentor silvarum]
MVFSSCMPFRAESWASWFCIKCIIRICSKKNITEEASGQKDAGLSTDSLKRLAIASLEAGSLRERNMAVRRRSEQRRMARIRRRQQASSNSCEVEPGGDDQQKWQEVRPFLTVNDHLCGPVSHGSCGPKTEVESLVEAAIADGDFDRAEMLSDHLANRQFAVKIADAFAARRCAEEQEAKRRRDYVKRQTKLPWGFEAKERWQMKGNM